MPTSRPNSASVPQPPIALHKRSSSQNQNHPQYANYTSTHDSSPQQSTLSMSSTAFSAANNPSPLNPNWQVNSQAAGPGVNRSHSNSSSGENTSITSGEHPVGNVPGTNGKTDPLSAVNSQIGSAYGPYAYTSVAHSHSAQPLLPQTPSSRFSTAVSESSLGSYSPNDNYNRHSLVAPSLMAGQRNNGDDSHLLWDEKDPEMDDALHRPDPPGKKGKHSAGGVGSGGGLVWSTRGCFNVLVLGFLLGGLLMLFAGYPILTYYLKKAKKSSSKGSFNLGGTNGTGQVPVIPNLPTLIDSETPDSARSRTGFDGKTYNLIFSDEFETDGRTFFPGDDPYWEAVDFHYWPTADYEWYAPRNAITKDGKLVLTMQERLSHNLNFESAMLQTWNKFCFTRGYIEVSVSLPGDNVVGGYWPGVWLMGNLGRPGYGATTEGLWPYSYDSCDVGTFANQTWANGTGPEAALTTGYNGGELSELPGQRLSACTCPGQDHPGPTTSTGRGAPEIDILEAQVDTDKDLGQMSQSFQIAPFDDSWQSDTDGSVIYDASITKWNSYLGGPYQQAVSGLTYVDSNKAYKGNYQTYGLEYWSDVNNRADGFITWHVGGVPSWKMTAAAVGPNSKVGVSQRIIPEEPMSIILNLGMSAGFQPPDFANLKWPASMYIDYVRVYQREGEENFGCDPEDYPTSAYIANHANAYADANLTIWSDAGYKFPRNSLYDGC
ncbi:Concanavalin A-like lectin/glucanase, subgroup [Phaffia rhodozyma]|uniref:Concanavalin A-like lectin/glucanase, subgroup n=1 Tax=Phaffia rhodozyma TaxID=264483 RepID=A0A0F7SPH5_PHARH|nr:Concanavalin A-like lectin/glucanase, subgroup [Phaffia rhodozyma]